jgi:hypothetical protein
MAPRGGPVDVRLRSRSPRCSHRPGRRRRVKAENAASSIPLNITFDCADELGATIVSERRPEIGWMILADPEGNEFCVEISVAELEAARAAKAAT